MLKTAMPQYIAAAREMNALERAKFGVWRGGDPLARIAFALGGLLLASLLIVRAVRADVRGVLRRRLRRDGIFLPGHQTLDARAETHARAQSASWPTRRAINRTRGCIT